MPSQDYAAPAGEQGPYDRIKAMILSSAIPPDTKLNIDRLSRELGVSQTPVREALQRLEGAKLVVSKKPRGLWTTPLLSPDELADLMEVRLLLEPWAARAVAVDRASNPGRQMLAEVERFLAAEDEDRDGYGRAQHDQLFHELIFRAVRNDFLRNSYAQLHAHLHLFRLNPVDTGAEQTLNEHRTVAEAILNADADAAETAMRGHLTGALDRFAAGLDGSAHADPENIRSSVLAPRR